MRTLNLAGKLLFGGIAILLILFCGLEIGKYQVRSRESGYCAEIDERIAKLAEEKKDSHEIALNELFRNEELDPNDPRLVAELMGRTEKAIQGQERWIRSVEEIRQFIDKSRKYFVAGGNADLSARLFDVSCGSKEFHEYNDAILEALRAKEKLLRECSSTADRGRETHSQYIKILEDIRGKYFPAMENRKKEELDRDPKLARYVDELFRRSRIRVNSSLRTGTI